MIGGHEASEEDEEEEISSKSTVQESEDISRGPAQRPGLFLPKFPVGGFKLRSTGTNLFDGTPLKSGDSSPQEIRASFPLSHKEETRNVVVENLLEKQLSKADIKVSSMPTTTLELEEREGRKLVEEEQEDCLSGSTNSLDEIEEATRRVRAGGVTVSFLKNTSVPQAFNPVFQNGPVDHFTVVCLVTWPMNETLF